MKSNKKSVKKIKITNAFLKLLVDLICLPFKLLGLVVNLIGSIKNFVKALAE